MDNHVRKEIIAKLTAIGVAPFSSRLLSQAWRTHNLIDLTYDTESDQPFVVDVWDEGVRLAIEKAPQKFQRLLYPSGQLCSEEICDVDDDYFTDAEIFRWHESGNLRSLSLRISETERQFVCWSDDGEVSLREIDRKEECFDRIECLNCGEHSLIDGLGQAGFGDSGYMYSDSGRHVIRWDSGDPVYRKIVGDKIFHPWMLSQQQKDNFEQRVKPLPDGSRFRFSNVARCGKCRHSISEPLPNSSWLVFHDRTIWTTSSRAPQRGHEHILLSDYLVPP